jgi:hypothetical protein
MRTFVRRALGQCRYGATRNTDLVQPSAVQTQAVLGLRKTTLARVTSRVWELIQ